MRPDWSGYKRIAGKESEQPVDSSFGEYCFCFLFFFLERQLEGKYTHEKIFILFLLFR